MGWIGSLIIRAIAWWIWILPRSLHLKMGDGLGAILRWKQARGGVVRSNLEIAFPGQDNAERREQIFEESYRSLGRLVVEVFFLFGPMKKFPHHYVEVKGLENWKRATAQGKGVLFASSHVGCWEVMAGTASLVGMHLTIVTKHLKPEWLHQLVHRSRAAYGVGGAYEPWTLKTVKRELAKGHTVGFIMDQYLGPPKGVRVPFFGKAVGSNPALAALARRTGAPVIPVLNYRQPDGSFVLELGEPFEWIQNENRHRELALNTAQYVARIEEHVRDHPEQWLWLHRRFKGDLSPLRNEEWDEARVRSHEDAERKAKAVSTDANA